MTIRVYVESYGCTANRFDLEIICAHLREEGCRVVRDTDSADILLCNTCGVKQPTEDRVANRLGFLSSLQKPLIITGCLPKINLDRLLKAAPEASVILGPKSLHRMPLALKLAESGEIGEIFISRKPLMKLGQPKIRPNPLIEIISICEGCLGNCAYCCVKSARGSLFSYPRKLIAERVKSAVSEGVKEVWITSQDNSVYGLDIGTNLAELLQDCCKVEGVFRLRVGMMNPGHASGIQSELLEAYRSKKIYKFIHLPVQSGEDETLRRMRRNYTVKEFEDLVKAFRSQFPKASLATDIICGFPGESSDDFEKTLELVRRIEPDTVNTSKFFSRPGTEASEMEQLSPSVIKNRSGRMAKLVNEISFNINRRWVRWSGRVLVDEEGRENSWIGRNFAYKPVAIRSDGDLLGRFLKVTVVEAFQTYLKGEVLPPSTDNTHDQLAS